MNIDAILDRIYRHGCQNDATATSREARMFNITPSTGAFLDLLVRDLRPNRILELGTSNGYSTCWLARAAEESGSMIESVDHLPAKTLAARENLSECGLTHRVILHTCDAGEFLAQSPADRYDLLFLDSDRSAYSAWTPDILRVIRFGPLVVDNANSHPQEMHEFRHQLLTTYGMAVVTLPIGKGQLVVQPQSVGDAAPASQGSHPSPPS